MCVTKIGQSVAFSRMRSTSLTYELDVREPWFTVRNRRLLPDVLIFENPGPSRPFILAQSLAVTPRHLLRDNLPVAAARINGRTTLPLPIQCALL